MLAAAAALGALWLGPGCSADIFDVDVDLRPQAYAFDFGAPDGTIPTVTCDPAMPDACAASAADAAQAASTAVTGPTQVQVSLGCDPGTQRCFAQAEARTPLSVDVRQDDGFTAAVEQRAISFVRVADVAYAVPTNTLTFDLPEIDVYVGPPEATRETDPGVVFLDRIAPIPAMTSFTDRRHLTVADGSPARALLESSVRDQRTFVVLLVAAPRLEAGAPVPGGTLEVDLYPRITLGFPR